MLPLSEAHPRIHVSSSDPVPSVAKVVCGLPQVLLRFRPLDASKAPLSCNSTQVHKALRVDACARPFKNSIARAWMQMGLIQALLASSNVPGPKRHWRGFTSLVSASAFRVPCSACVSIPPSFV